MPHGEDVGIGSAGGILSEIWEDAIRAQTWGGWGS